MIDAAAPSAAADVLPPQAVAASQVSEGEGGRPQKLLERLVNKQWLPLHLEPLLYPFSLPAWRGEHLSSPPDTSFPLIVTVQDALAQDKQPSSSASLSSVASDLAAKLADVMLSLSELELKFEAEVAVKEEAIVLVENVRMVGIAYGFVMVWILSATGIVPRSSLANQHDNILLLLTARPRRASMGCARR